MVAPGLRIRRGYCDYRCADGVVPGVALTNAMREIMAGDIISGLSRTADAILVASAIALGTVVGLAIGQML